MICNSRPKANRFKAVHLDSHVAAALQRHQGVARRNLVPSIIVRGLMLALSVESECLLAALVGRCGCIPCGVIASVNDGIGNVGHAIQIE